MAPKTVTLVRDTAGQSGERAASLAEAAAWCVRLQDSSAQVRIAFERWLAAEPANAAAWRDVYGPWQSLDAFAQAPELLELRRAALHDAGASRQSRRARLGMVAAVLLVTAGSMFWWRDGQTQAYATGVGERRVITLADGSELALDSASEVRVAYTCHSRDLRLIRGQARFTVKRDGRPFSVVAGASKVVATGTQFNIDVMDSAVSVTLMEGHVVVKPAVSPPLNAPRGAPVSQIQASRRLADTTLSPGQRLEKSATGAARVRAADIQTTSAWETGRLIFQDELLPEVLLRFGRYTQRTLRVPDPEVSQLRISGVFDATDIDGFITTIATYLPVQARYLPDGVIELHAARNPLEDFPKPGV